MQIVRNLAMRLPAMILPRWLESRSRPVALDDAVAALVAAASVPLEGSVWFELPGPEPLSGRQILLRRHLDGCGAAPDSTDWVRDCGAQTELRSLLDLLLLNLGQSASGG